MELSDWFKGFEKGIARLSPEQRSAFFSECSKNCVDGSTLSIYRKLYEDAGGDMDVFFQLANGLPEVKGEVAEKGRDFQVKLCHSILQGEPDCKMRIEVV
ncbi:MAG TPA: hypothetical protein IAC05_01375 [Candidatus Coprenecus stercorigallinarum]|nr:hypothetical protein [Candidatus Coprenecus stercorigallinarum]